MRFLYAILKNRLSTAIILLTIINHSFAISDNVQFIGKTVFPITGTSKSQDGQCIWEVSGGVTLILSFSKSTSLAGFLVKRNENAVSNESLCPARQRTQSFKIPLTINTADRSFFAVDEKGVRKIVGKTFNLQVTGNYFYEYNNPISGAVESWSGTFSTSLKEIPGEIINVDKIKGSVLSSIPMGISNVQDSIPDASTIVTAEDSSATLHENLGSKVDIKAKTIVTRLPVKKILNKEIRTYMLINGRLDSNVSKQDRNFEVVTPIAKVAVDNSLISLARLLADELEGTEFSTEYQQDQGTGVLTVDVTSGTVVVTDQDNNEVMLQAGQDYSLSASTNRTSWVQPADGGIFYGGIENILAWTSYPDAAQYILEYNFPNPVFSEENSNVPEYIQQSIEITPDLFSVWENLVIFPIILPDLPETLVEVRIYALDQQGNVLSSSVSSDRATMLFK
jgi:hypothetical protein